MSSKNSYRKKIFLRLRISVLVVVLSALATESAALALNKELNKTNQFAQVFQKKQKSVADYFNQGLIYLKRKNYEQAIADFSQTLKLQPDHLEALIQRGLAYLQVEDYRSAFYDFDKLVELQPNNVDALFGRGKARFYQGTAYYSEAIDDFTQVILLKPDYADAYLYRADASSDDPRYLNYDQAIADINQFLKLRKNLAQFRQEIAEAYRIRGSAYLGKGAYNQAISDLTQALELKPDLIYAYLERGSAYYAKQEYKQAIADYTQLLQSSQNYSFALSARAEAYLALGDYDRAITDYTQELKALEFDNPQTYYNRGYAYTLKGDKRKAIGDFEKVIELTREPDFPGYTTNSELRQKAQQQLQKLKSGLV